MTNFALVIWSYQQYGSALQTAMTAVCSYAPYVVMSIFAGALSDRWNKKATMLVCDSFAALCTVFVLILLQTSRLEIWHIYVLNALNGLMNTIQQLSADLVASMYNAALPAMILSSKAGGEVALGTVNAVVGIATLIGSILVSVLPSPKSRVKIICNSLLFSMSTENFFLAFGGSLPYWCIGAALGWLFIPVMSANMDVLFRNHIPVEMQGRVYSTRNTLQFFTIPIGYFLGGILVDRVFEPFMKLQNANLFTALFGDGKGSGAALLFLVLAISGIIVCLMFRKSKYIWTLE